MPVQNIRSVPIMYTAIVVAIMLMARTVPMSSGVLKRLRENVARTAIKVTPALSVSVAVSSLLILWRISVSASSTPQKTYKRVTALRVCLPAQVPKTLQEATVLSC